jgi:peptidoglycan-associated lipoprotein
MNTTRFALFAGLALVAVACNHEVARPPAATATADASGSHQDSPPKSSERVGVSDDLARACKLTFDNPKSAPKFDRDNADLTSEDRAVLDQIARCITAGPLRGSSLSLVGRADPRGEQEYNMVLGGSRAAAVRTYLTQAGVEGTRIATTSRGKLDAIGSDEESWRLDRRVDVELDKNGDAAKRSAAGARTGTGR